MYKTVFLKQQKQKQKKIAAMNNLDTIPNISFSLGQGCV